MKVLTSIVAPGARGGLGGPPLLGFEMLVRAPVRETSVIPSLLEPGEASKSRRTPEKAKLSVGWAAFPLVSSCLPWCWPCTRLPWLGGCLPIAPQHGEMPLVPPLLLVLLRSRKENVLPATVLPASSGMLSAAVPGLYKIGMKRGRGGGRGLLVRQRNAERGLPSGAGVRLQCISHKPGGGGEGRGTGPPGM